MAYTSNTPSTGRKRRVVSPSLKSRKLLDKHLKPIKSGGENSSLELATEGNGAKIKGDLEITGSIISPEGYFSLQGDFIIIDSSKLYFGDLAHSIRFLLSYTPTVDYIVFVNNSAPITTWRTVDDLGVGVTQFVFEGGEITAADTTNVYDSVLNVKAELNDTSDSGSCVHKLIEGVYTNTDITGWDELYLLHLTGAAIFYIDNAGNVALAATKKLYFDGGGDTYIYEHSDDILVFKVGDDIILQMAEVGGSGNIVAFGDSCAGFTQHEPTYDATDTQVYFNRFGNKAFLTFGSGDITNLNLSFPNVSCNCLIVIKQDGTGSREITNWITADQDTGNMSTVAWSGGSNPTLSTGANAVDIVSLYWDNGHHQAYGTISLNFATP